jgi:hypothetical protein
MAMGWVYPWVGLGLGQNFEQRDGLGWVWVIPGKVHLIPTIFGFGFIFSKKLKNDTCSILLIVIVKYVVLYYIFLET